MTTLSCVSETQKTRRGKDALVYEHSTAQLHPASSQQHLDSTRATFLEAYLWEVCFDLPEITGLMRLT